MSKKWEYQGDVNLHYGGFFANLDNVKYGYVEVVSVTDLDSGCGFETAAMIEHKTVMLENPSESKRMQSALDCCGLTIEGLPRKGTKAYWMTLIDAALSYGIYDPDDGWDNYRSFHREIVQQEKAGPMLYDGWKADINLRGKSLKRHILNNHLKG